MGMGAFFCSVDQGLREQRNLPPAVLGEDLSKKRTLLHRELENRICCVDSKIKHNKRTAYRGVISTKSAANAKGNAQQR